MVLQLCTTNTQAAHSHGQGTSSGHSGQAQPEEVPQVLYPARSMRPSPTPLVLRKGRRGQLRGLGGGRGGASLGGTDERPWGPGYVDKQLTTRWSWVWGPVLTFTSTDAEYMASSMGTSHATTLMRGHRPAAQPNAVACTVSTGTSSGQSRMCAPSNIHAPPPSKTTLFAPHQTPLDSTTPETAPGSSGAHGMRSKGES
jgi:hypothetical protein